MDRDRRFPGHHQYRRGVRAGVSGSFLLRQAALIGRNLPDITRDFSGKSIDLTSLYNRLDVPMDLVDEDAFRTVLDLETLPVKLSPIRSGHARRRCRARLRDAVRDGMCDFAALDEDLQTAVIRRSRRLPGPCPLIQPELLLASKQS